MLNIGPRHGTLFLRQSPKLKMCARVRLPHRRGYPDQQLFSHPRAQASPPKRHVEALRSARHRAPIRRPGGFPDRTRPLRRLQTIVRPGPRCPARLAGTHGGAQRPIGHDRSKSPAIAISARPFTAWRHKETHAVPARDNLKRIVVGNLRKETNEARRRAVRLPDRSVDPNIGSTDLPNQQIRYISTLSDPPPVSRCGIPRPLVPQPIEHARQQGM